MQRRYLVEISMWLSALALIGCAVVGSFFERRARSCEFELLNDLTLVVREIQGNATSANRNTGAVTNVAMAERMKAAEGRVQAIHDKQSKGGYFSGYGDGLNYLYSIGFYGALINFILSSWYLGCNAKKKEDGGRQGHVSASDKPTPG